MTWNELLNKYGYRQDVFNAILNLLPSDVIKEIKDVWNGGEKNFYVSAEAVLSRRKDVDIDEIDRKYCALKEEAEMASRQKKTRANSNARIRKEFGKLRCRAEMLAAMDCLMHHLDDSEDRNQFEAVAIPNEGQDRHILDVDPKRATDRRNFYAEMAKRMSDNEFECVVHTFADIVRGHCFSLSYNKGRFK